MHIKLLSESDANELVDYYVRNEQHLHPWSPKKPSDFGDVAAWTLKLREREKEMQDGAARYFCAVEEDTHRIIGLCSLTNITYGVFMACFMGYSIDKEYEGQGCMKKLCFHAIQHAFNNLKLHRVMANYMPSNTRSGSLLKRLGFRVEGEAEKYLKINDKWEDHILTSLINRHH